MKEQPTILVVDDDDTNRRLMDALLSPQGYEVILAHNGVDALKKVEQFPPDVILLDVMMPQMDGFAVVKHLKADEQTRNIPIVMVTALNGIEERVKALEVEADDFLSKPIYHPELMARVKSLLKVKAYHDHLENYQQELEAEVARQTEKLRHAALEMIYRLALAAEYRDDDTGWHILRMSHYAAILAHQIGYEDREAAALLYAAPMHDVGKIGIPDSILLKNGKLEGAEWNTMKKHTTLGSRILEGSEFEIIQLAQVIALTHHEKWDGSGYPKGLKGQDIPLVGRITAVADVFDALTSKRPYKEALPVEEAKAIIRAGAGAHFDPDVVEAFFAAEDDILSVMNRFEKLSAETSDHSTDRLSTLNAASDVYGISFLEGALRFDPK